MPSWYAVCFLSLGYWFVQKEKFQGVEEWPKVKARIIDHGDVTVPYRRESRYGTQTGATSASYILFEYVVDGRVYQSERGSPNGGEVPTRFALGEKPNLPWNESWDAYYKPGEPELAVLSPVPYQGDVWVLIFLFSGFPVIVHAAFWVVARIALLRKRRTLRNP